MEHPSQHRYPVWWTGDGVNLQASIQSMVDNGVHDFKPYVHSDCGGDSRGSAGDLLRWTAHCVFGTVLRFHGSDHRPWTYDAHTEAVILSYLNMRYKLIPTFISAGQAATTAGYPLVVRGDLIWPDQTAAASNTQYIHLNDTLVAPIWDSTSNTTSRSVWIPPGSWQDAWSGAVQTGPQTITVSQPYEQIPMWHRRGTFTITVDSPARRVEDQDWSILTLETYPDFSSNQIVEKSLFSKESAARTDLSMETVTDDINGVGLISFRISESEDRESRGWVVRLHLLPGQECLSAMEDGNLLKVNHISPVSPSDTFFPFGGVGTAPAHKAGKIAEIYVPKHHTERSLKFVIQ
jgi:alpha-glucosidase (family GH31 glycosyl hydrolase)